MSARGACAARTSVPQAWRPRGKGAHWAGSGRARNGRRESDVVVIWAGMFPRWRRSDDAPLRVIVKDLRSHPSLLAFTLASSLLAGAAGCRQRDAELRGPPPATTLASTAQPGAGGEVRPSSGAAWNALKGDAYELDHVDRFVEEGRRLACEPKALVRYAGTRLKYQGAVQVNPAFRERLSRFEEVVAEVAHEVYGRAPRRVLHLGTYSCRSTRKRSYRVSEHALGNAIDIAGFDFGPASKKEPLVAGLPRALGSPFQVKVKSHWSDRRSTPASAAHARFLSELASRLSDRDDVFRGMIGPSRPDHSDHFHFDMSPWRYVWF
jgi:hypothetical protein